MWWMWRWIQLYSCIHLHIHHTSILCRLCSDDSDFSEKSEAMWQFFDKRGYPVSLVQVGHHRAQQIVRQSALQTAEKDNTDRIPFTLTFHPHNIGNFLVRSSFQTDDQSGTFKCARSRCKTCSFIHNVDKISGPKRSIKIIDHFTCTSANVICCITCTYWNKLYIGETGRRLSDRFREHLRDVERNDKDAPKPVARHFNLPNHSEQHMSVCGLSLQIISSPRSIKFGICFHSGRNK